MNNRNKYVKNNLKNVVNLIRDSNINIKQIDFSNSAFISEFATTIQRFPRQYGSTTAIAKSFNLETDYYISLPLLKNSFIEKLEEFNNIKLSINETKKILCYKNIENKFRGVIIKPNTTIYIDALTLSEANIVLDSLYKILACNDINILKSLVIVLT